MGRRGPANAGVLALRRNRSAKRTTRRCGPACSIE